MMTFTSGRRPGLSPTLRRSTYVQGAILLVLSGCSASPAPESPQGAAQSDAPQHSASEPGAPAEPASPGPTPAEGNASDDPSTAIQSSPLSVIALHRVSDLDKYRAHFERHADARRSAGVTGYLMSRALDDSGRVLVHFAAESKEKATAFLASPAVIELLEGEGAPDSSVLWTADNVLIDLPKLALVQSQSLYLKTTVADFSRLQTRLAASVPTLRAAGLGMLALMRSTEDPHVAIIHMTATDRHSLDQVYTSPAFQASLADAGANKDLQPVFAQDIRK